MHKRYLIIFVVLLLGFLLIVPKEEGSEDKNLILLVNEVEVVIEIADTDEKRSLGLSGRDSLPKNEGLLFVFETPGEYSFWMKDMNFPIDIIWIGEDEIIKSISRNISPSTYPETFSAGEEIKFVLEVNAGFANENNININDVVSLLEN